MELSITTNKSLKLTGMQIQLIEGQFTADDALKFITEMFHAKIKYHENKIHASHNEEDAKFREKKIKNLQKSLYEIREYLELKGNKINIHSTIQID